MEFFETSIKDVIKVKRSPLKDKRGFFERVFCENAFSEFNNKRRIKQINRSFSIKKGSFRGMHVQIGRSKEAKIITCTKGKIFDIALDLRKRSETFLKWTSIELSSSNNISFILPEGVAHGFQCLESHCELLYFHSAIYDPKNDIGININDPLISIDLPLKISNISKRDLEFNFLKEDFRGF